jgi:hypothetical protein
MRHDQEFIDGLRFQRALLVTKKLKISAKIKKIGMQIGYAEERKHNAEKEAQEKAHANRQVRAEIRDESEGGR